MTQLTKKKLKEIMLQVIENQDDDWSKDSWYATNRTFAKFGIDLLAKELNIDLELGEDYD